MAMPWTLALHRSSEREYVERRFWQKCKRFAARTPFVLDAVAMYYCSVDAKTPLWAKGVVLAALAYLINPFDAVHDVLPLVGFTDDASAIAAALTAIGRHVTDEHKRMAREWADRTE